MDVFTRIREQMAGLTVDGTFPAAVEAAIEEQMPVPPPEPIEQETEIKKHPTLPPEPAPVAPEVQTAWGSSPAQWRTPETHLMTKRAQRRQHTSSHVIATNSLSANLESLSGLSHSESGTTDPFASTVISMVSVNS